MTLNAYFPKGCGQSGVKIGLNLDTMPNLIIIDTFEFNNWNIANDEYWIEGYSSYNIYTVRFMFVL